MNSPPAKLVRMEPFLWLELLPFLHPTEGAGVESLVEYTVWKKQETTNSARRKWLPEQVYKGVINAVHPGRDEDVKPALSMGPGGRGHSPWVELLADKVNVSV